MKEDNQAFVRSILRDLSDKNVKYLIVDERWKEGGDVDLIVSRDTLAVLEDVLRVKGFVRKGFWPPWARAYYLYRNDEALWIGVHVGGYIGGFGGGLGQVGKVFSPTDVVPAHNSTISKEAQIFILIYKFHTRKKNQKYVRHYDKLIKGNVGYAELRRYFSLVFTNPAEIAKRVRNKTPLEKLNPKFKLSKRFSLIFSGKFNRALRVAYKIIKPAPYIAFVGCNGTGKSTTTKRVRDMLEGQKLQVGTLYSGRFRTGSQILPINFFARFLKPSRIERGKNHHKGEKRKNMREVRIFDSKILRITGPIVYYVDYLLRYIFKVYPLRVKSDIVITDRSFIDIFNSPNLSPTVSRVLFKLMPNPRYILLYNDPEVLNKRRPEFQLKHIRKQLEIYSQFDDLYIMKVKTEKPEVINDIVEGLHKVIR